MDGHRFDLLAKALVESTSRRTVLRLVTGGALATLLARLRVEEVGAACRRKDERCGDGRGRCCGKLTCCNGRCRNTRTDERHCGECNTPCPDPFGDPIPVCADSRCAITCPNGRAGCGTGGGFHCCAPGDFCLGEFCHATTCTAANDACLQTTAFCSDNGRCSCASSVADEFFCADYTQIVEGGCSKLATCDADRPCPTGQECVAFSPNCCAPGELRACLPQCTFPPPSRD